MKRLKRITSHPLARQGVQMLVYLGLSRLLTIAGSAWAARCLGPEKLGISAMILATTTQLGLFVNCNLDVLFGRKFKAAPSEQSLWSSLALSQRFVFSVVLGGIGIAGALIAGLPSDWWLGILAAYPLFVLTSMSPSWQLAAQGDGPANYRSAALSSVCVAALYVAFFRPGQATGSDILVQVAGTALSFCLLARAAYGKLWPLPVSMKVVRDFWPVFKEGRWMFVTGLVGYIVISVEVPLLGYLCSLAETGKYRLAYTLVGAVQQALTIIPMLLFPKIVEWKQRGPAVLWNRQVQMATVGLALIIPVCLLAAVAAPRFFHFVYGEAFVESAYPFSILLASKFLVVISGLFAQGLWVQEQDKQVFWVVAPVAVISLTLNLLLLPRFGMRAASWVNFCSEMLVFAGCVYFAWRHKNQPVPVETPPALPPPLE